MATTYKVRGNGDSTLPIEDWAKGLTRAFSKRRKSYSARSINFEPSKRTSAIPAVPQGYDSDILSLQARNVAKTTLALSRPKTAAASPSVPIEDWVQAIPLHKPIPQPRNPRRSSLIVTSAIYPPSPPETDCSSLTPSSPASTNAKTDWHSDADSERSAPNVVYRNYLDQYIDSSRNRKTALMTQSTLDGQQSSCSQSSPAQFDQTVSTVGMEKLSLRSLFFGGTQLPRDRPPRLSISSRGSSNHVRRLSIASSSASFTTASEFVDHDGEQISVHDLSTVEHTIETQIMDEVVAASDKRDLSARASLLSQYDVDTGIDEDYSLQEEGLVLSKVTEAHKDAPRTVDEQNANTESYVGEETAFEHCVPGDGSLADVLFQVAISSPYNSSDSEDTSSLGDTSASDQTEISSQSDLEEEIRRYCDQDSSSSIKDSLLEADSRTTSISVCDESAPELQRTRPAQNYKMINGKIIAFEPWRMPGQFDLSRYSPPSNQDSDTASYLSESSSQQSGSFLRANNRWNWIEQETIPEI